MGKAIFNNLDAEYLAQGSLLNKYDGWEKSGKYDGDKINKITDTQGGGGIGYFKLGTSIPTPFARIFMFRNAFNRLTDMEDNSTIYGKLVSETLDFLEFIFHFGKDIEVKKWSFSDDIARLKGETPVEVGVDGVANPFGAAAGANPFGATNPFGSGAPTTPVAEDGGSVTGHALLADCLLNMRSELGVKDATGKVTPIDNIYLFYYRGVLIGGTSPFTLVFTSPNWQRKKNIGVIKGDAGNELFPNYQEDGVLGTPLHRRDLNFIQFLMAYRHGFGMGVTEQSLINYIDRDLPYITQLYPAMVNADSTLRQMGAAGVSQWFMGQYVGMEYERTPIYANDINGNPSLPLAYRQETVLASSDYTIQTAKPAFIILDAAGSQHTIQNVLVLSKSGLASVGGVQANYVGGHPWDAHTYVIDPNIASVPLYERILPGPGRHQQPFITVYDLFEDQLLRVPYNLDSQNFETYVSRDWKYLLPLKKLFFNFFGKEFLSEPGMFNVAETDGVVTFQIRIPVTFKPGGSSVTQYLTLEKSYGRADIKDLRGASWFAMAMFPSYRVMTPGAKNDYTIMVANGQVNVDMAFYNIDDMQNALSIEQNERPDDIKSRFYRVREAFDFIEVSPSLPDMARPVHALIIPKFRKAYMDDSTGSSWKFGIDFGTSNTYIAATQAQVPSTFEIARNEAQVMYLDRIDTDAAFGSEAYMNSIIQTTVGQFHDAANREFAPMVIGHGGIASYPFQTITCESTNFSEVNKELEPGMAVDNRRHLFSKFSIGFNVNHEEFSKNYIYRSDIKWAAEKEEGTKRTLAQKRVELYCEQIAWMLKNKLALSSKETAPEHNKFTVYFTYPCSMGQTEVDKMYNAWSAAFGPYVDVKMLTESEAPYYYLAREGEISDGKNFLNIDIGGGTTDMFYVIQEGGQQRSYYTSMRFAGNDLWGDGVKDVACLTNGFYNYVKKNLPGMEADIQKQEDMLLSNPDNTMTSADLMAYLFRRDTQKNIPNLIQTKQSTLYPLLLVHYGAIIYHVAMILKAKDWDVPKNINLTGMGSKYVHIIASQQNVTKLTAMLLKKFTGKDLPRDFKLTYSESNAKEVTAQGALLSEIGRGKSLLSGTPEEFRIYGFPETKLIKYEKADDPAVCKDILESYDNFIKAFLEDEEIQAELKINFNSCDITPWLIEGLRNKAEESYIAVSKSITDKSAFIRETLFFWPLKNAIYELSKEG